MKPIKHLRPMSVTYIALTDLCAIAEIQPPPQWRLLPDALKGQRWGGGLSPGGKSPNKGVICLLVPVTL